MSGVYHEPTLLKLAKNGHHLNIIHPSLNEGGMDAVDRSE